MNPEDIQSLEKLLEESPADLRVAQLMERSIWDAIEILAHPNEPMLFEWSDKNGSLALRLRANAKNDGETWRVWYGGQLQALASLMRATLLRELPLPITALLNEHSHAVSILKELSRGDCNLTQIGTRLEILDTSQVIREVTRLSKHDLVETAKVGRERWVRLTMLGRQALNKIGNDGPRRTPAKTTPSLDEHIERRGNANPRERDSFLPDLGAQARIARTSRINGTEPLWQAN